MNKDTTVVLTSCGRHDLLEKTIESFFKFNTYDKIKKFIVVEDGLGDPSGVCKKYDIELIKMNGFFGQIHAIDCAYSQVNTDYIFHMEDDWEFYKGRFIENSRKILEVDLSCICVWLRSWDDLNGHPLAFKSDCRNFGVLAPGFQDGLFNGFTWNPGLRRLSDYRKIAPFAAHTEFQPWKSEATIGQIYHKLGYRAVVLDHAGYVRHTGWGRHIDWPPAHK